MFFLFAPTHPHTRLQTPGCCVHTQGVEFHAALRAATGDSGMPSLPPELANLPQPARVRKLAAPLHQLFMQFDNGDMTTDVFRERMRALGLRENLEVDRLLRQDGLQFSQLFKALAMQGGNDVPLAGQAAGAKTHRTPSGGVFGTKHNAIGSPSKRAGKRTGFKDLRAASAVDPISWRNNVVDGTRVRKKKVGQYSTARNNNNSSRAAALGHERYLLKSDLQNRDTGASMSLYGRPIGSTAGTKLEDATNEGFFQGGKAGHSLPIESGAGAALWGYNQHGGYETEAQRTARGGLQKGGGPATSAGYGSRDHGLLREQIYSAYVAMCCCIRFCCCCCCCYCFFLLSYQMPPHTAARRAARGSHASLLCAGAAGVQAALVWGCLCVGNCGASHALLVCDGRWLDVCAFVPAFVRVCAHRHSIRQLDRSELDTASFRLRLKLLGCEVPAEVDRLLTEYDANGRATFKDFVRAFEKYFAARAAARATTPRNSSSNNSSNNSNNARRRSSAGGAGGAGGRGGSGSGGRYRAGGSRRTPPRRGSGSSRKTQEEQQVPKQATTGYMDRSHLTTFTQDDTPAALRTHGDILTWTNNPPVRVVLMRGAVVRFGRSPKKQKKDVGVPVEFSLVFHACLVMFLLLVSRTVVSMSCCVALRCMALRCMALCCWAVRCVADHPGRASFHGARRRASGSKAPHARLSTSGSRAPVHHRRRDSRAGGAGVQEVDLRHGHAAGRRQHHPVGRRRVQGRRRQADGGGGQHVRHVVGGIRWDTGVHRRGHSARWHAVGAWPSQTGDAHHHERVAGGGAFWHGQGHGLGASRLF